MSSKPDHGSMHMSVKQLVTAEQLSEMPELPGRRLELVDGVVIEVSPATMLHGVIVTTLARLIDDYARGHDLGIVGTGAVGYVLRRDPDLVRAPDVSFVSWERVPETGIPDRGFWDGAPTLAVEVVSPDDRAEEVHAKVRDCLDAGTRQVWVLWPRQRTVTVYIPDGAARELTSRAPLEGGEVLPGFTATVGELFEVPRR
jgi:Uma2 family endonuclease